jgi:hypothetical protein
MIELFVENSIVDINVGFSTLLTYAIDDIKDFGAKNTTFSKTIILPGTKRNNILFGNIFEITGSNLYDPALPNKGINFNAAISAKAYIFADNIQCFKGIFRILQVVIDDGVVEYECSVVGELGGFVSKMGNLKLEDLDFSENDHTYSLTNIVNSWDILQDITYTAGIGGLTFVNNMLIIYAYDFSAIKANDTIVITSTPNNNGTYIVLSVTYNSIANETTILIKSGLFYGENTNGVVTLKNSYKYGYHYPLIDYGTYSSDKHNWQYKTFRPALFVKQYIDKIFDRSGYSYVSDLFSTARFKKLIIPNNRKVLTKKASVAFDRTVTNGVLIYPNLTRFVVFNNAVVTGSFLINAAKNTFTYNGTNGYNCGINYNIQGSFYKNASYPNYRFEVRLLVNNNPITSSVYFGYQQTTGNFSFDVTANNIVLNNGDVINLEITLPFAAYYSNNYQFTFGEIKVNNIGVQETEVSLGDTLKFNDLTTKNILQKDFISSIVKLFNLYIFEDANSLDKVLKIMPFVDFYADAETIDWSDKIDRSKPLKVKPMSQLNARYYEFSFKSDSDYYNDLYKKRYNEDYGSYKFDSGYEFSKESTKVELIFSGTPIVGKVGQDKVYSTILKRTGDVQGQNEETTDSNIRILQAKKVTGLSIWNILNGGTTLGSYTVYPYAGHLNDPDAPADDIQFGVPKELFFTLATGALNVNQFNIYWKSYMQEITDKDSKMLTCNARLKYKDIYNLDFSKLIWVDGSLFRLNKIIDFNATAEDECTVELLKIINRIY